MKKLKLNLERAMQVDFNRKKIQRAFERIRKQNEKLLNESEIDYSRLHIRFDV